MNSPYAITITTPAHMSPADEARELGALRMIFDGDPMEKIALEPSPYYPGEPMPFALTQPRVAHMTSRMAAMLAAHTARGTMTITFAQREDAVERCARVCEWVRAQIAHREDWQDAIAWRIADMPSCTEVTLDKIVRSPDRHTSRDGLLVSESHPNPDVPTRHALGCPARVTVCLQGFGPELWAVQSSRADGVIWEVTRRIIEGAPRLHGDEGTAKIRPYQLTAIHGHLTASIARITAPGPTWGSGPKMERATQDVNHTERLIGELRMGHRADQSAAIDALRDVWRHAGSLRGLALAIAWAAPEDPSEGEMIQCVVCHGAGKDSYYPHRSCYRCDGQGEYFARTVSIPCVRCVGVGMRQVGGADVPCTYCDACGRFDETVRIDPEDRAHHKARVRLLNIAAARIWCAARQERQR